VSGTDTPLGQLETGGMRLRRFLCFHPTCQRLWATAHIGALTHTPSTCPPLFRRSTEEAEALRVLLEQQNLAAGELGAPVFVLEPGRELSLQDLDRAEDRTDQGSPEKQHQQQPAASGAKATRSPRRRTAAAAAAAAGGGSAGRKPGWAAGAGSSSNSGRGLLSTRCDDTAVSSSRGVRSSATSESRWVGRTVAGGRWLSAAQPKETLPCCNQPT
jgi:hypothetical protein